MKPDVYVPWAIVIAVFFFILGVTFKATEHMGILQSFTNFIQAVGICAGVWVAFQGLRTWKQELHGKSEFATAKDLLVSSLKLRDDLRRARIPGFVSEELGAVDLITAFAAKQDETTQDHVRNRETAKPYVNAWNSRATPVASSMEELKNKSIDVEIFLGPEGKEYSDKLLDSAWDFILAVRSETSSLHMNGHPEGIKK